MLIARPITYCLNESLIVSLCSELSFGNEKRFGMAENQFPESVRRFINQYIDSVEQLEILLLVSQEPSRVWTVDSVLKVIQSSLESVAARMKNLAAFGFFAFDEKEGGYRFNPNSADMARQVEGLREAYTTMRVRVIQAIFSGPGKQAQHFADSFRFRKDK